MPSALHEGPILLLRERPDLLLTLLARSGVDVPTNGLLQIDSADFSEAVPIERRADLVVTLGGDEAPSAAFVVEVQLEVESEKWFSWPFYLASLHTRKRCPSHLVVVAPFEPVAAWARRPIATMQPTSPISPIVRGPSEIPAVLSEHDAMSFPELAVLSAIVHATRPDAQQTLQLAVRAMASLDDDRSRTYFDLVHAIVGAAAKIALEALMPAGYEYQSEFAKRYVEQGREEGREQGREEGREQGREEGREEGREQGREEGRERGREEGRAEEARRAIFAVLAARAIVPSSATRARIESCSDLRALERWIARAAVASTGDDVDD